MLDRAKIRRTMRTQLKTVEGVPDFGTRCHWENRDFTPPDPTTKDVMWLKETLIPINERMQANNTIVFDGMMVYDLYVPRGRGTALVDKLAKAIGDKFKPATSLVDACKLHIRRSETGTGHSDETKVWYVLSVIITITAYDFITRGA